MAVGVAAGLAAVGAAAWLGVALLGGGTTGDGVARSVAVLAPSGSVPPPGVPADPPAGSVAPTPARPPAPPLHAPVPVLPEAAIAAHVATVPTMLRLAENDRVFVLDFPSLAAQAEALNRVAALTEKAGLPRDRVLTEAEMEAAIARTGGPAETYYYGHDYRADDLDLFFALAERDGLALRPGEAWVREQLARARAEAGTRGVALISVPAPGPLVDEAARRTILRHEVGHGHEFTLPFYAAHVRRVWRERLTEAERAGFRAFLAREGYDVAVEDLVATEFQAYVLFTPDERFFAPAMVGIAPARMAAIRAMLAEAAPPGHEGPPPAPAVLPAAATAPPAAPR